MWLTRKSLFVIAVVDNNFEYSRLNTQAMPMSSKTSRPRRRRAKKNLKATHQKQRSQCGMPGRAKKSYQRVVMQITMRGRNRNKREDKIGENTQELRS